MELEDKKLWEQCVTFYGHECGGLMIGYRASLYAAELLGLKRATDEEIVCIAECDACSVEAIQVALGCSVGKGNLLFHITGKFAFSFYDRRSGKSVRLLLVAHDEGMTHEESNQMYFTCPKEKMFQVGETRIPLPEPAKHFHSILCDACGEMAAENHIHLQDGQRLCDDCRHKYDRFAV